jgi:hypothetical protein
MVINEFGASAHLRFARQLDARQPNPEWHVVRPRPANPWLIIRQLRIEKSAAVWLPRAVMDSIPAWRKGVRNAFHGKGVSSGYVAAASFDGVRTGGAL